MSGSSSAGGKGGGGKRSKKSKKEKWEEAGGEFYQERYPGGQGQAASTADLTLVVANASTRAGAPLQPRPHFPLPSQTARRNSLAFTGRRGYLTRKHSYGTNNTLNNGGANNCMTYNSTMGRISEAEVHIALMPDMADETIPDEKSTNDALLKLKALPESMAQKRSRKAKLGAIPQRRLSGWNRMKWAVRKRIYNANQTWHHDFSNVSLFKRDLQKIEVRCGTAIVNVFLFIRWTLLLNLLISFIALALIIVPYFFLNIKVVNGEIRPGEKCKDQIPEDLEAKNNGTGWPDVQERMECCAQLYLNHDPLKRGSLTVLSAFFLEENASIEHSPFFYGYYVNEKRSKNHDLFAFAYVFAVFLVLGISLILMVRSIGEGIKEIILASEGEHNPYTNLILAGWDHYTKDAKSALFKRKIMCHEMKVALKSEKNTLETVLRSRNEQIKLTVIRLLVNIVVLALLGLAGWAILKVSTFSLEIQKEIKFNETMGTRLTLHEKFKQPGAVRTLLDNLAISFTPSVLITILNVIFPLVLAKLGKLEKYSLHTSTALVLYRALFIRLMSIGFAAAILYNFRYCHPRKHTCTTCIEGKESTSLKTRGACWESIYADQLYKLLLVDILIKCIMTLLVEPLRVQLKKCSKNKIFQKIGTMKFSIVRHSLDIIYLQVISWVGLYFGPFIPIMSVIYAFIVFYVKKFSLINNCNTVPDTLKTMKTTTTFVAAKLMAFIAVTFTNVFVLGYMVPSRGCGPFRQYDAPWRTFTELVEKDKWASAVYNSIASPGITAPFTLILLLAGYYYYSVAQANRGMVDTLRHLLILEGHDKQYLFARLNSLRRGSGESGSVRMTPKSNRTSSQT
ncbi:transmembrane channel-like protein 7 [Folsomia candida]|nr:transmembrane channel-like protein 7 [Folsomia candida]